MIRDYKNPFWVKSKKRPRPQFFGVYSKSAMSKMYHIDEWGQVWFRYRRRRIIKAVFRKKIRLHINA